MNVYDNIFLVYQFILKNKLIYQKYSILYI